MAASVVRTARSHGVDREGLALISRAHALAMKPRVDALDDDHHPLYLHPGRSLLVLLRDAGVTEAAVLAAAALVESEDEGFRISLEAVEEAVGREVAELVGAVPPAADPGLAEALITAGEDVRLVALAERLDHLRHAHLVRDDAWKRTAHGQAVEVYWPVAERTDEGLAGRYRYWCRMFERRFLGG